MPSIWLKRQCLEGYFHGKVKNNALSITNGRATPKRSKSILGLLSWLLLHWILLATSKVMSIMFGGFDRMGEGDSKKMQKLVLNRAKTNQTRDWPYLSQFLDFCHGCGCIGFSLPQSKYQLMSLTYRICLISVPIPVTGPEGPS